MGNASLLTEDNYITVHHSDSGVDLDWTWASSFNVQFYYDFYINEHNKGSVLNELYAPETQGWRSATKAEFDYFKDNISAGSFFDGNSYKNSFDFFNSDQNLTVDSTAFVKEGIRTEFPEDTSMDGIFTYYEAGVYETFYVRTSSLVTGAKPIPEPLTIILFAIALIALQIRQNKKSA